MKDTIFLVQHTVVHTTISLQNESYFRDAEIKNNNDKRKHITVIVPVVQLNKDFKQTVGPKRQAFFNAGFAIQISHSIQLCKTKMVISQVGAGFFTNGFLMSFSLDIARNHLMMTSAMQKTLDTIV